jgi:hypothetical protein
MLNERTVIIVSDNVYFGNIGIYKVGKAEIDKSVSAREGYSRNRSVLGKS